MKTAIAFLKGKHPYAFRSGETAGIIGVKLVKPEPRLDQRPCFETKFPDGEIDLVPISEVENGNYEIVSKLNQAT